MHWLRNTVLATILLSQVACGTLLYPERQGVNNSGRIDPTVLLLDGVGLLFFIVPGIAAFVVDFSTGAIYLPAGSSPGQSDVALTDSHTPRVVKLGDKLDLASINQLLSQETGVADILAHRDLLIQRIQPSQLHQIMDLHPQRTLQPVNLIAY